MIESGEKCRIIKHSLLKYLLLRNSSKNGSRNLGRKLPAIITEKKFLLICILRGGVLFLTDLMRQIDLHLSVDFMAVSSYGTGARESTGNVRITLDLNTSLEGKNVILVEDIVDSGRTIASVLEILTTRHPKSLVVCTLAG